MPNFYVHIVESPSSEELFDGLTEGRALCSFLDIAKIPYSYNLAVDPPRFHRAMTERVVAASKVFGGLPPILHFSTHGDHRGIQLTSQRDVGGTTSWSVLADYIRPIHQIIGNIGVCMSCCGGAHGAKMAQVIRAEDVPFAWIIGTSTQVDLRDAALAYSVFYRRYNCDDSPNVIQAMRAASGVDDFDIWFGDLTQQQYSQDLVKNFQQWLQAQQPPPPPPPPMM